MEFTFRSSYDILELAPGKVQHWGQDIERRKTTQKTKEMSKTDTTENKVVNPGAHELTSHLPVAIASPAYGVYIS
jgi:hypothetical protein